MTRKIDWFGQVALRTACLSGPATNSRRGGPLAACLLGAVLVSQVLAASPSPAILKKAREATFEVVVHKAEPDPLTYDRPPPLDLVPFVIRTDAYWSIGSAFAIGPNTFVTAAHVLVEMAGGQFGTPALRDAQGRVFPIDRILKFSMQQDFAVFSVHDAPAPTPLVTQPAHHRDEIVYAVGNALGQGVVLRDGLLTSETPEEQDGRWRWIRYSAAASPGSSGGPLLDGAGAVIGVITAKSPNENLNYALPIGVVLDAPAGAAVIDTRQAFRLPMLRDADVLKIQARFDLPKSFEDFADALEKSDTAAIAAQIDRSLGAHAGELFPAGNSAKLLASGYTGLFPSLATQGQDKTWQAPDPEGMATTDLAGDGSVTTATVDDVQFFRLVRPDRGHSDDFYADPKSFTDLLLKGVKIARPVGGDSVRVVSLGPAQVDELHTDRNGRVWQLRVWWLGYQGNYFVLFCLPTPDGYEGFERLTTASSLHRTLAIGKVLADEVLASYSGTPPQWQSFLARGPLRPAVFKDLHIEFDGAKGLRYESPSIAATIPGSALPQSDRSLLELSMFFLEGDAGVAWGVAGIKLQEDFGRVAQLRILRHAKPRSGSGQELQRSWEQMLQRKSPYNGMAQRLPPPEGAVILTTIGAPWNGGAGLDPAAKVLYEVGLELESDALPREVEDRQHIVLGGLRVLEH
jgi:hypothetical protein